MLKDTSVELEQERTSAEEGRARLLADTHEAAAKVKADA